MVNLQIMKCIRSLSPPNSFFSSRKQYHTVGVLTIRILGCQPLLKTGKHCARESVSTLPYINELQDSTLIPETYVS